jgi:translocation and assembly module TamB
MDSTPALPAPAPPARPLAAALRLLMPLWAMLALLALVVLAGSLGARWLLLDEAGTRWLLARVPGVQVTGLQGALLGDTLRAERLQVRWGKANRVDIEALQAQGLHWHWLPGGGAWLVLQGDSLSARRVVVTTVASGQPVRINQLRFPARLQLAQVQADEVVVDSLAPVRDALVRDLRLDGSAGGRHSADSLSLRWLGSAVTGHASIGNSAPLPVGAQLTVTPQTGAATPDWAAVLRASGVLEQLDITATLRGVARSGRAAPALDLTAQVRPLAPWPLSTLAVRTAALDLAALLPGAPQTRLTGSANIRSTARDAPIAAKVELDNAAPGRWNEGRLPVRRLELELSGQPQAPDRLEATRFAVWFADGPRSSAGRWSGRASWLGHGLDIDTALADVNPQRLDGRAASMSLSGPLTAHINGLPSPDPSAKTTLPARTVDWTLDLQGAMASGPQPVRLALKGSASADSLQLREVRASSGAASAELRLSLQRAPRGAWQLDTAGQLSDFDPLPWWPGELGSAWRKGPHRLSGEWQIDVRLPADTARLAPLALAQALDGRGMLRVQRSLLAGVPLQAELSLGRGGAAPTAAAEAAAMVLHAQLQLGGNQAVLDAQGNPGGPGTGDRWQAQVRADKLANLAPLAALHPLLAATLPRQGSVQGDLMAQGRWPAMRSSGDLRLQQLQVGGLSVATGQARWQLQSDGARELSLQAEASGVQLGRQRATQLRADLSGTLADHLIELSGTLPLAPSDLAGQLLGLPTQAGTQAQLKAHGAWLGDAGGGGRWRARVERLALGGWDGKAAAGQVTTAWAEARELRAELDFDAQGDLTSLRAEPGRLRLADSIVLRWDAVSADLRGERALLELRADVDAFSVAPLLARLQPTAGWGGDLRLRARLELKARDRFDADVIFERVDGDLQLSNSEGVQLMGLTEFNLALAAHDGLWSFNQAFSGRSLGDIRGSLRARTAPERRWPGDEAPIEGNIQARVSDIGIWNNWVPPGWRLAGELRTTAAVSGRFGQPQYTGDITGSGLSVRNLLQGVNVSDGQVSIRLAGDVAQVERFTLRGGDGRITVSGSANLGATPSARLQAKAERFRVLGRVDRLLIASGQADMTLQADLLKVDGAVKVDEGLIDASNTEAPTLDDDVSLRKPGDGAPGPTEQAAPRARRNIAIGIDVDLGDKLQVRGRGLDTTLAGKLRITTPGGRLAVAGTVNTERGTYKAYGQKLDIERGILAFSGAVDNPRLDVLALRPNIDNRVGVAISGNVLTPRIRLFADPEMSDNDKLAWLLLGRAPDGLGRADTALLQRAALALLAGEGEAPTDTLMRNLGIDEVSLRQGDGETRDTVISLGKQLSRRWYVGYERSVNATTGTWQLIYRIAQRFTVRAQSGVENSLDMIWVQRLGEPPPGGVRKSVLVPP